MFEGDEGFLFAQSGRESLIAGAEVGGVLDAGCAHRGGAQGGGQPAVAVAGCAGFVFAGGFVVSGADSGPGG
jgi:hypothetical protein